MIITRCILVSLLALLPLGCGRIAGDASGQPAATKRSMTDTEAASATLSAMLEVAEAGAWRRYVTEYYGELHKAGEGAKREAAINELTKRFEQRYGPQVIEALRRARRCTPTIDAEGRAVFAENGTPVYVLYKDDRGRWTFHL
jgi:hypothetical protein